MLLTHELCRTLPYQVVSWGMARHRQVAGQSRARDYAMSRGQQRTRMVRESSDWHPDCTVRVAQRRAGGQKWKCTALWIHTGGTIRTYDVVSSPSLSLSLRTRRMKQYLE